MELFPGIYEQVINEYLLAKLNSLESGKSFSKGTIARYDTDAILSRYIKEIIGNVLRSSKEQNHSIEEQIAICNRLIEHLACDIGDSNLHACKIADDAEILLEVLDKGTIHSLYQKSLSRPETSIAQSSLWGLLLY